MRAAVLVMLCALALTSCSLLRDDSAAPTAPEETSAETSAYSTSPELTESTAVATDAATLADTSADTAADTVSDSGEGEELPEAEASVGLYDDIGDTGTYTRLDEWTSPWIAGVDIAVFDLIPSSGDTISGSASYKELWSHHAAVLGEEGTVKPYVILEYTLSDGTSASREIRSYADAEAEVAAGYVEVYLYDDIHQPEGAWYSHLTEYTTDGATVISSVKLTGGAKIDSVAAISLTACLDGEIGGRTTLIRAE